MCKGISGIIHQKRSPLLWVKSNSHSVLLEHFKIDDSKPIELRRHVKFELWPLGSLTSTSPAKWRFALDEDEKPDWFIESDWAQRCIKATIKQIIPHWVKYGCPCDLILWNTKLTSLGKLRSVGGDLDLEDTRITSLGKLQRVGGSLDLENARITSLSKLQGVGGDLYLQGTRITSLGKLKSVGGGLHLQGARITSLGKLESVGRSLYLQETKITKVPEFVEVGGRVCL